MSDIPVGSPPAPPGRHAAPGGWYPDPVDPAQERYWDGWQWSRTTRAREAAQPTPQRPYGAEPQNPYAANPVSPGYGQPGYGQPGYGQSVAPTSGRAQAAATADGVPLAGWWWRVLATLVDGLITSTAVAILGFSIYRSMVEALSGYLDSVFAAARAGAAAPPQINPNDLISAGDQALLAGLTLAVGLAYQVIFLRRRSATPGKILCGLRVVPVDQGRATGPLGWNAIIARSAIWVLPSINTFLGIFRLVDVLFPLFQPKRQALHDLAARTQVVRRR